MGMKDWASARPHRLSRSTRLGTVAILEKIGDLHGTASRWRFREVSSLGGSMYVRWLRWRKGDAQLERTRDVEPWLAIWLDWESCVQGHDPLGFIRDRRRR
jgi:hypothetical protein